MEDIEPRYEEEKKEDDETVEEPPQDIMQQKISPEEVDSRLRSIGLPTAGGKVEHVHQHMNHFPYSPPAEESKEEVDGDDAVIQMMVEGLPTVAPPATPAAAAAAARPPAAGAAGAVAGAAAAAAAAPAAADPAAIAASAAALQAAHMGPGYWFRTNRQPADPQNWYHIRWTTAGSRVSNYWKHRGGPRLTDHERDNLVDDD